MSSYYKGDNLGAADPRDSRLEDYATSGPYSSSYEQFIHKVFKPQAHLTKNLSKSGIYGDMPSRDAGNPERGISAMRLLKMEEELGSAAIDERLDAVEYENGLASNCFEIQADNEIDCSPLDMMHREMRATGLDEKPWRQYEVYQPKQSSEYYSVMYSKPIDPDVPIADYQISHALHTPNVRGPSEKAPYRLAAENRSYRLPPDKAKNMLIDYEHFESPRLSPYMYPAHPYVHRNDTRIIGSNFAMLTLRPRDAFLDKIDKTLAEARAIPRY